MVKNMKNTTYRYVVDYLERKAAEAQRLSAEYAEGEEHRESQWQDGRAQGIREALAMVYTLDPDRERYQDERPFSGSPVNGTRGTGAKPLY